MAVGPTMSQRRRWGRYLGPIVFALLSVQCGAVEVTASGCPELTEPTTMTPGETVTVVGSGFERGGCGGWSPGCASRGLPVPLKDVAIDLRQGERSWRLDTVDANADLFIRAEVSVPADLQPGEATLEAAGAELPVTVEAPTP